MQGYGDKISLCVQEAEAFLARSVCESPLFLSFPFSITFLVTSRHHLAINGHQITALVVLTSQ